MNLEQEFKKETGFDAYIDNDLSPKIPMGYYIEWLEEKINATCKNCTVEKQEGYGK